MPLMSAPCVGRFLAFAGEAPLVAHNARFDQRFLERQLRRRESRRLAEPPLCTAALARRLLEGRLRGVSLASLAHFFGVATTPCHRALPDAEATAQVLVRLIGLAQELGARRLSELRTLAAPRARRVHGKRAAHARRADAARGVPLPRPARARALRRPCPRPARPSALLLPERPPAPLCGGGAARPRADRVAASSAPSSRPRSRSSG